MSITLRIADLVIQLKVALVTLNRIIERLQIPITEVQGYRGPAAKAISITDLPRLQKAVEEHFMIAEQGRLDRLNEARKKQDGPGRPTNERLDKDACTRLMDEIMPLLKSISARLDAQGIAIHDLIEKWK
jgi:hypothetical protein